MKMEIGEKSMSLTDDMNRLKKYAVEHEEDIFSKIDYEAQSYWEEETTGAALTEYMFDTPVELSAFMKEYLDDDMLRNIVIAASFKKKDSYRKSKDRNDMDRTVPDYVYNF